MFKEGDFVKLKPNTKLESGIIVNDWAGVVVEVYMEEKTCLISLDAQTINAFDDAYLINCIEEDVVEPFVYIFEFNELDKSTRRDTDAQVMDALDTLASRMIELEVEFEDYYQKFIDEWDFEPDEFSFLETLDNSKKKNVRATPLKNDPFQGIGRNQKITVKYKDGKIFENIKFKKIESDLRKGICEILKG